MSQATSRSQPAIARAAAQNLRAGRVVGKEAIVQSLTSLDNSLSDNAIEQYVSRLRRRLQPHGLTLRTARGLGYMLERPAEHG